MSTRPYSQWAVGDLLQECVARKIAKDIESCPKNKDDLVFELVRWYVGLIRFS